MKLNRILVKRFTTLRRSGFFALPLLVLLKRVALKSVHRESIVPVTDMTGTH